MSTDLEARSSAGEPVDDATAHRLAVALRCVTVSREENSDQTGADSALDAEFARLGTHLEQSFPRVHAELELEKFGHSRLYTWRGIDDSRTAALLLAHQDVVPAEEPARWTHPPFAGVVDEEFIWGRGAIDDKSRVLAILEAVESGLAAGLRPRHTVYLAFGHDEEVFGNSGAVQMAARLRERGVRADLLLDEGGVITEGIVNDVRVPVATIMIGEKGCATIRLSVSDPGGHSSMPGRQTAIGRLARAVSRIQDSPMPLRVTPVVTDMLARLRPYLPATKRRLLGFTGAAAPVVARIMAAAPQTEALVRTTTAPTVIRGGVKDNVLPQQAEAFVNFRILPGDSVDSVLAHCRRTVRDDRVRIEVVGMSSEPSTRTGPGPDFEMIAEIVRQLVPEAAVTTGLVPGATDSRHYDDLVTTRCNFAPIRVRAADLERIHGNDERLSRVNYARLIEFNRRLVTALAEPERGGAGRRGATDQTIPGATMTSEQDIRVLHGEFEHAGHRLSRRSWIPATPVRGVVVLVHGVAEHSGRYDYVGRTLAAAGFAVHALDHVGHGASARAGAPANLGSIENAADNVAALLELARAEHPGVPAFVIGHSMGALITLYLATRAPLDVAGVVVSAPPLIIDAGNPVQRLLAPVLTRIAPNLGVLKMDSSQVSRDPEVVAAYDDDPLVFRGKLPARTATEILVAADRVRDRLPRLQVPTLALHGTADAIAAPASTDLIEQRAGSTDLTVHHYDGLYHEIFNEPERDRVLADVVTWLSDHAPASDETTRDGAEPDSR